MSLKFKSHGGLFPHSHTLEVPFSAIESAPADGIVLTTSSEYSLVFKHNHQVRITQKELLDLKQGKEIKVFDTDMGRHSFLIRAT